MHEAMKTWIVQQPYGVFVSNRALNSFDVYGGASYLLIKNLVSAGSMNEAVALSKEYFTDIPECILREDIDLLKKELIVKGYLRDDQQIEFLDINEEDIRIVRLEIELTRNCNLACKYCYAEAGRQSTELAYDTWDRILSNLYTTGLRAVVISGGEPFLYKDIMPLLELIGNFLIVEINTNGFFITPGISKNLSKLNLKCVQISLDSATADIHDKYRGAGSWSIACGAIKMLGDKGVPVRAAMTLHSENMNQIANVMHLAESLGADFVTNSVKLVGRAKDLDFLKYEGVTPPYSENVSRISDMNIFCESELGYLSVSSEGLIKPCNMTIDFFKSIDSNLVADISSSDAYLQRHVALFEKARVYIPKKIANKSEHVCVIKKLRDSGVMIS